MSRDAWDDDDISPGIESLCVSSVSDSNGLPHDKNISPAPVIPGPIDEALLSGLENPRERMNILKFEDRIIRFMGDRNQRELVFEQLASYHRLIVHRLAQRFQLDHQAMDAGQDGPTTRGVVLRRTPQSKAPTLLLIDLPPPDVDSSGGEGAVGCRVSPGSGGAKLLMRRRSDEEARGQQCVKARPQQTPTITDREKAYAEARAKIFGSSSAEKDKNSKKVAAAVPLSREDGKLMGGQHMAVGPAEGGQCDFATEQGKAPGPLAANTLSPPTTLNHRSQEGSRQFQEEIGQLVASNHESLELVGGVQGLEETGVGGTTPQRRVVNVSEWVGQRVKFRDVNTDRQDADFTRGAHYYQLSGGVSSGAVGTASLYGYTPPSQTSMEAHMHSRLHLAGGQPHGLAVSTGSNGLGGLQRPGVATGGLLGGPPFPPAHQLPAQHNSSGRVPPYLPVQHLSAAAAVHPSYYAAPGTGPPGANTSAGAAQAFAIHQAAQQQAALGGLYGYSGSPPQAFAGPVTLPPPHDFQTAPPPAGVGYALRGQQHQPSTTYQQEYHDILHPAGQTSQGPPPAAPAPPPLSEGGTTSYEQDFPPLG